MVNEPVEVHELEFKLPAKEMAAVQPATIYTLEQQLGRLWGVCGAYVIPQSRRVLIRYDPHKTFAGQILKAVEHMGYSPKRSLHRVQWNLPY